MNKALQGIHQFEKKKRNIVHGKMKLEKKKFMEEKVKKKGQKTSTKKVR